jgi:hypothetical protein
MNTLFRGSLFFAVAVSALTACSSAPADKDPTSPPDLGDETGTVAQADSIARPISTSPLAWGEIARATFSPRAQFRAYTFDGEAGQAVSLYADGLRGLDTVIYVYRLSARTGRPFGRAIAANDDAAQEFSISGGAINPYSSSIVDLRLPETRAYALVVTTYGQRGSGDAEVVGKSAGGIVKVTLAQLEQSPASYDGKKIEVTAEPDGSLLRCTKMACSQANPCCNACGSGFAIGTLAGSKRIALEGAGGAQWGCSGNECTQACNPFPSKTPGDYVLRGTFQVRSEFEHALVVDSFRAAACHKGGCSGQVCSGQPGVVTACGWRPEYACYRAATCEAQADGHCGWTRTPQLQACLAAPPNN